MPAGTQGESYADLVALTLNHFQKKEWTDIAIDTQYHTIWPMLITKDKIKYGSGPQYEFKLRTTQTDATQAVLPYQPITPSVANRFTTGTVPWRHLNTSWAIEERLIAMNASQPEQIIDLVKAEEMNAMTSLVEFMEEKGWSKPTDSTSDDIFGIPYWVVQNATQGFNGGDPSGFSSGAANLLVANAPRWKNYTDTYSAVTRLDMVAKVKKALYKTDFKPPVAFPNVAGIGPSKDPYAGRSRFELFSTETTVSEMELLAEGNNDNMGGELLKFYGRAMLHRTPVLPVPYLDANTSNNPLYGIDWSWWVPIFLRGEYMKRRMVELEQQHRTIVRHIDNSMNLVCTNRRANFVMYKA